MVQDLEKTWAYVQLLVYESLDSNFRSHAIKSSGPERYQYFFLRFYIKPD